MTWNKIEDCEVIHHWKCEQKMDYEYTECNQ